MSVKDCAAVFQEAAAAARGFGAALGGFAARVNRKDNSGFFTPTDNSPFSSLDDDKPAFAVGVGIPKFNAGAQGNVGTLHMYVWDRGDFREVQLFSPHGLGGGMHSAKLIRKAIDTFRAADQSAKITSD
ncbi:hypothetical protein [Micromonospora zhanjiangensis]|uniref:Bacteriophage HK97-gp10, tail-component n=1 Tax=Micromonospora zhanjiangensis TaxID=1522057 RepID=A0ABV8KJ46_9ACTN